MLVPETGSHPEDLLSGRVSSLIGDVFDKTRDVPIVHGAYGYERNLTVHVIHAPIAGTSHSLFMPP
jgi:hypothetical protein